jgi:hypothetical protein
MQLSVSSFIASAGDAAPTLAVSLVPSVTSGAPNGPRAKLNTTPTVEECPFPSITRLVHSPPRPLLLSLIHRTSSPSNSPANCCILSRPRRDQDHLHAPGQQLSEADRLRYLATFSRPSGRLLSTHYTYHSPVPTEHSDNYKGEYYLAALTSTPCISRACLPKLPSSSLPHWKLEPDLPASRSTYLRPSTNCSYHSGHVALRHQRSVYIITHQHI